MEARKQVSRAIQMTRGSRAIERVLYSGEQKSDYDNAFVYMLSILF